MSMEEIIRSWKADGEALDPRLPASPIGQELTDEELLEVSGAGVKPTCTVTCGDSCGTGGPTCPNSCLVTG